MLVERHLEIPGGPFPHSTEDGIMDTDTDDYSVILQSTVFAFEANVSMVFFRYVDDTAGQFSFDVSCLI